MPFNRRLQVLLDEEQFGRLERAAAATGASVGAIVRRAIDRELPPTDGDPRKASAALLAADPMPVEDWPEMKREMRESLLGPGGRR